MPANIARRALIGAAVFFASGASTRELGRALRILERQGMRDIDYAFQLLTKWESFKSAPYLCPAGKWTIGFGTTHYPDGKSVCKSDRSIDQGRAGLLATAELLSVKAKLERLVRVPLTPCQWGALIDLGYNLGVGIHDGVKGDLADSTLLDCINRGDMAGAAQQFLVWNKAHVKGKIVALAGLTHRREDEKALFETAA
jgi:lysozyme